jgi:hypothetical protein
MIFQLKADVTFEAENLFDAFEMLSDRFEDLAVGVEPTLQFTSGSIEIRKVTSETSESEPG